MIFIRFTLVPPMKSLELAHLQQLVCQNYQEALMGA